MYSSLRRREFSYNNRSDYPPTYPLIYYTSVVLSVGINARNARSITLNIFLRYSSLN
jgi:hypothetical protein